jgi:hypothetical protein
MSLKDHWTNFSQSFAKLHFTFMEVAKNDAIYKVLAMDQSMIHHAKVQSMLHHVKVLPRG